MYPTLHPFVSVCDAKKADEIEAAFECIERKFLSNRAITQQPSEFTISLTVNSVMSSGDTITVETADGDTFSFVATSALTGTGSEILIGDDATDQANLIIAALNRKQFLGKNYTIRFTAGPNVSITADNLGSEWDLTITSSAGSVTVNAATNATSLLVLDNYTILSCLEIFLPDPKSETESWIWTQFDQLRGVASIDTAFDDAGDCVYEATSAIRFHEILKRIGAAKCYPADRDFGFINEYGVIAWRFSIADGAGVAFETGIHIGNGPTQHAKNGGFNGDKQRRLKKFYDRRDAADDVLSISWMNLFDTEQNDALTLRIGQRMSCCQPGYFNVLGHAWINNSTLIGRAAIFADIMTCSGVQQTDFPIGGVAFRGTKSIVFPAGPAELDMCSANPQSLNFVPTFSHFEFGDRRWSTNVGIFTEAGTLLIEAASGQARVDSFIPIGEAYQVSIDILKYSSGDIALSAQREDGTIDALGTFTAAVGTQTLSIPWNLEVDNPGHQLILTSTLFDGEIGNIQVRTSRAFELCQYRIRAEVSGGASGQPSATDEIADQLGTPIHSVLGTEFDNNNVSGNWERIDLDDHCSSETGCGAFLDSVGFGGPAFLAGEALFRNASSLTLVEGARYLVEAVIRLEGGCTQSARADSFLEWAVQSGFTDATVYNDDYSFDVTNYFKPDQGYVIRGIVEVGADTTGRISCVIAGRPDCFGGSYTVESWTVRRLETQRTEYINIEMGKSIPDRDCKCEEFRYFKFLNPLGEFEHLRARNVKVEVASDESMKLGCRECNFTDPENSNDQPYCVDSSTELTFSSEWIQLTELDIWKGFFASPKRFIQIENEDTGEVTWERVFGIGGSYLLYSNGQQTAVQFTGQVADSGNTITV